jgi:hypothetical protein
VGCLYCGKDIGPFRQFRDDEFCSAAHRKQYGERLGKVIDRIGAPELVPSRVPGAREVWPVQEGHNQRTEGCWDFGHPEHPVQTGRVWPLTLAPILGSKSKALALAEPVTSARPATWVNRPPQPMTIPVTLPMLQSSIHGGYLAESTSIAEFRLAVAEPHESRPKGRVSPLTARRGSSKRSSTIPLQLPAFGKSLRAGFTSFNAASTAKGPYEIAPRSNQLRAVAVPVPVGPSIAVELHGIDQPYRPSLPRVDGRMPGLPAEAVERHVWPTWSGPVEGAIGATLPSWKNFAISAPQSRDHAVWQTVQPVEPAIAAAAPTFSEQADTPRTAAASVALPGLKDFFPLPDFLGGALDPYSAFDVETWFQHSECPSAVGHGPSPVQSFMVSSDALNAIVRMPTLRLPDFLAAALVPSNPFDFDALIPDGMAPAVAGPAPSPVQTFITCSDAISAIAPAATLRLPSLGKNFEPAFPVGTLTTTGAWPSPIASLLPSATQGAMPVAMSGPQVHLPISTQSFPAPLAVGTSGSISSLPSPVESGLAAISASSPSAVTPDFAAIELPAVEQSFDVLFTFGRSVSSPTLPSPVASMLPLPQAPEPIALTAESVSIRLPEFGRALDLAVSKSSSKAVPALPTPVPSLLPAAAAATLVVVDAYAEEPELSLDIQSVEPAYSVRGTGPCPTWPTPVQSFLAVSEALIPIEMMPAPPAVYLPTLLSIAQTPFSSAKVGTRPAWPTPAELPTRAASAPAVMAAEDRTAPVQLPGTANVFTGPSVLGGTRSLPTVSVPAVPAPAAKFVPQPLAAQAREMFLSLPKSAKSGVPSQVAGLGPAAGPAAYPAESMPAMAAFAPFRIAGAPSLQFPRVPTPMRSGLTAAGSGETFPRIAAPGLRGTNAKPAVLEPLRPLRVARLAVPTDRTEPVIPQPGFIPVEFYCQRGQVAPHQRLAWHTPVAVPTLPTFGLRTVVDRTEDLAVWKPGAKNDEPTEISISDEAKRRAREIAIGRFLKIAACVVMGTFLWFGAHEASIRNAPSLGTQEATARPALIPGPGAADKDPKGLVANVRSAIAGRAATTVTDNMQAGMQAWGTPAKAWSPGWSRNADGYVRPGELALFAPSLKYKDYRLEFFGQIENKSMGWAVRAQDKQNYYAMKFTVIEAGLRPVIAMSHYPVVGGKRGHKIDTPLSVMVHNNTPIHVAIDVQGRRVTASVEGQQVDSWTDELLPTGGVGFFADAGEHARLYWMKVSKNQDWLGTVCSYLSDGGGSSRDTAEVWGPGIPAEPPVPGAPAQPQDVTLAEAEISSSDFSSPQRARIWIERRNRPWS